LIGNHSERGLDKGPPALEELLMRGPGVGPGEGPGPGEDDLFTKYTINTINPHNNKNKHIPINFFCLVVNFFLLVSFFFFITLFKINLKFILKNASIAYI
jgi:hypothetical protein